jgi:hypothetical protein
MDKKLIIKALRNGVPLRRISRELKIPASTLCYLFKRDKEYQMALDYHKTLVDNIFS